LKGRPFRLEAVQGSAMANPCLIGRCHQAAGLLMAAIPKAVQPTALLRRTPQSLGLPLNCQVNEQRPQFQEGLAVDADAVNAAAAADPSATTKQVAGHHQG